MTDRQSRGTLLELARSAHRWLGLGLLVVLATGTVRALPVVAVDADLSLPAAVFAVFAWEAAGGGPANEFVTLLLMIMVAALGVTLLIDRLARRRGRGGGFPRDWPGRLRLAHRWIGVAFTVTLAVHLLARAMGGAPALLGWAWLWLLLAVNCLGLGLLVLHVSRAARRQRADRTTRTSRAERAD